MPHDPRIQRASGRNVAAHRRKNATKQDRQEVRRDLACAQIEVAIDRALAASALRLTEEQVVRLTVRLTIEGGA